MSQTKSCCHDHDTCDVNGGVVIRHAGDWCFLLKNDKIQDFGGINEGDESIEECMWRGCCDATGLDEDNVIQELGVFEKAGYSISVVVTSKAPLAKEPDTSIVRYATFDEAKQTGTFIDRLCTLGLEFNFWKFEKTSTEDDEHMLIDEDENDFTEEVNPDACEFILRYKLRVLSTTISQKTKTTARMKMPGSEIIETL